LGENRSIDIQDVSESPPKPFLLASADKSGPFGNGTRAAQSALRADRRAGKGRATCR